jgi:CBS domain-containing protein
MKIFSVQHIFLNAFCVPNTVLGVGENSEQKEPKSTPLTVVDSEPENKVVIIITRRDNILARTS